MERFPLPKPSFETVTQARRSLQSCYATKGAILTQLSFESDQNNKMFWTADFSARNEFPIPTQGNFVNARAIFQQAMPVNGVLLSLTIRNECRQAPVSFWSARFGFVKPTKIQRVLNKVKNSLTQCYSITPAERSVDFTAKTTSLKREERRINAIIQQKETAKRFYLLRKQKKQRPTSSENNKHPDDGCYKKQQQRSKAVIPKQDKPSYAEKLKTKKSINVAPNYNEWEARAIAQKISKTGLVHVVAIKTIMSCKGDSRTTSNLIWARHQLSQLDYPLTTDQLPLVYNKALERLGITDAAVSALSHGKHYVPGLELNVCYNPEQVESFHSLCSH